MDNPNITHNTRLHVAGVSAQAYVETGKIWLDLNPTDCQPVQLDTDDAGRLVRILQSAIADKES